MENLKWSRVEQDNGYSQQGYEIKVARIPGGWLVRHSHGIAFVPHRGLVGLATVTLAFVIVAAIKVLFS